jgi:hypothetical protein
MAYSKHPAMKGVVLSAAEVTFYDTQFDVETAYQVAIQNATTQAQMNTLTIAKYRNIVAAIPASSPNVGGPARVALHELTGQYV